VFLIGLIVLLIIKKKTRLTFDWLAGSGIEFASFKLHVSAYVLIVSAYITLKILCLPSPYKQLIIKVL